MALELYDCYIFFLPILLRPSHVTFKIPAVRTKNMADISLIFSAKIYILS